MVFFGIFVPIVILIFWTILKLKGLVEVEEYEEEIEPKKPQRKTQKQLRAMQAIQKHKRQVQGKIK